MNTLVEECLTSINALDTNSYEKEMAVCEAFIETYNRAMHVLEYYRGDDLSPLQLFASSSIDQVIVEMDTNTPPPVDDNQTKAQSINDVANADPTTLTPGNGTGGQTTADAATATATNDTNEADKDKKSEEKLWDFEFRHNKKDSKEKENIVISILFAVPRFIAAIGKLIYRGVKRAFSDKNVVKSNDKSIDDALNKIAGDNANQPDAPKDKSEIANTLFNYIMQLHAVVPRTGMSNEELTSRIQQTQEKMNQIDTSQKYPFILGYNDSSKKTPENFRSNAQGEVLTGALYIFPSFNIDDLISTLKIYHASCVSKLNEAFEMIGSANNPGACEKTFKTLNEDYFVKAIKKLNQMIETSDFILKKQSETNDPRVQLPDGTDAGTAYSLTVDRFYELGNTLAKAVELILKDSEILNEKLSKIKKGAKDTEHGGKFTKEMAAGAKALVNNLKQFNEKMNILNTRYMDINVNVKTQSDEVKRTCWDIAKRGFMAVIGAAGKLGKKAVEAGKQAYTNINNKIAENRKLTEDAATEVNKQNNQRIWDHNNKLKPLNFNRDPNDGRIFKDDGSSGGGPGGGTLNLHGVGINHLVQNTAESAEIDTHDNEVYSEGYRGMYYQNDNIEPVSY